MHPPPPSARFGTHASPGEHGTSPFPQEARVSTLQHVPVGEKNWFGSGSQTPADGKASVPGLQVPGPGETYRQYASRESQLGKLCEPE
jgi:hypothetical protein